MAREIMQDGSGSAKGRYEKLLVGLVEKCRREGIQVNVQDTDLGVLSGIRMFLKNHGGIDKVVLSPAVTGSDTVSAKDLNRLVRTASRPIVTMTRQACGVAC